VSIQARIKRSGFVKTQFLGRGFVNTTPNLQAGEPLPVGCPRTLIQYIRSYPPYWRPFLHPQTEDAPCHGDRVLSQNTCHQKDKAVPLQAWRGPEGSRKLRFPDFMTTAQEDGKAVSLTHRPHLPLGNSPGTHVCYRLI
jgi:hypothetical protein